MDKQSIHSLTHWIIEKAVTASINDYQHILPVAYKRLVDAGLPLLNVGAAYSTLHPLMAIVSLTWIREEGTSGVQFHGHDQGSFSTGTLAPFGVVHESGMPYIRLNLKDSDVVKRNPAVANLVNAGATDFLSYMLTFSNGESKRTRNDDMLLYWTTDCTEGFTAEQIDVIELVQTHMAVVFKLVNRERLTVHIVNAYLGQKSGAQVLNGEIKRGDGQNIRAVIWFCDLRGSTPLSERLEAHLYIDMLNDYFDALANSVIEKGGEILSFIGDEALAIFPVGDDSFTLEEAKSRALDAACLAQTRAEACNERRLESSLEPFEYGIGLHYGEIMYGNMGIPSRLQFSVIGLAANQAARVESLCKDLNEPLLVSDAFVDGKTDDWRSMGKHTLRGVERQFEIFAPLQ